MRASATYEKTLSIWHFKQNFSVLKYKWTWSSPCRLSFTCTALAVELLLLWYTIPKCTLSLERIILWNVNIPIDNMHLAIDTQSIGPTVHLAHRPPGLPSTWLTVHLAYRQPGLPSTWLNSPFPGSFGTSITFLYLFLYLCTLLSLRRCLKNNFHIVCCNPF